MRTPLRLRASAGIRGALAAVMLAPMVAFASASPPATVEWQLPVEATHAAQTKAQDLDGMRRGRSLPSPEVLRPMLDPALVSFEPRYGVNLKGTLRLMSSDILPKLIRSWGRTFSRYYPHVSIVFGPPFEGSDAARALIAGRVDIAFVSREMKPTNVGAFRAKYGYDPTSVPVSGGSWRQFGFLDAVTIIVNKSNPVRHLTFDQLDAVFSRSHLRGDRPAVTWGQLGAAGAWADKPVHVYALKPWGGYEEFVRQRVLDAGGKRGHWRTDLHFDKLVFPIARRVADDPDGIGITGLAFLDAPVKVLAVGEGAGVSPTFTNVALGKYPLSRLIYGNVNRRPGRPLPRAVQEFLRFILSRQGQQDVRREGIFLPLRHSQVRSAERIADIPDWRAQPRRVR